MADNTTQSGTDTISTDELTSVNEVAQSAPLPKAQRVKVGFGDDGSIRDISLSYPLPINARPLGYTTGLYQVALQTGDIAAGMASNGELLQFRWTNTSLAVIQRVTINGLRASTAFASGPIDLRLTKATGWSAAGTGGTGSPWPTSAGKLRTSMSAIAVGDLRIATTAALGAGTKTLDGVDTGLITAHAGATPAVGQVALPTLELFSSDLGDAESPLVLGQNEGFVVRATVPGTGVWKLGLTIKWAEAWNF